MKQFICFLLGHQPTLNGQQYEQVTVVRLDGIQSKEARLIERKWCGRCRKLLQIDIKE